MVGPSFVEQNAKLVSGPGAELSTKELRELGCGRELGRFTLLRRVATGGMAEVYVARTHGIAGFEKKVAIKKILPQHSHNSRFIDMLVDEAKITVSLQHPNIAQVYELGLDDDTYFIVMEYVDGRPLNKLMQRVDERGIMTIPLVHAAHVMSEISKGLDHAHKQKDQRGHPLSIVHRDVSPQNVLISYQGDVKLIDFGIARAEGRAAQTSQGVIKGKLRYLAPEIAAGEEPDARADVFCCGIVLFEMLTGEAMFAPKSDLEAIAMASEARVRSPRSRNPKVPADLDDICMRALKRDRNERYQSARELHLELRRFLSQTYPTFVGAELGEFMHEMFAREMLDEKRLDARAEQLAMEASVDYPAEEEPTMAGTPEELISAGIEARRRAAYKPIVTRIGIPAPSRTPRPEVRLIGADGGRAMDIVLDDASARPRIASGSSRPSTELRAEEGAPVPREQIDGHTRRKDSPIDLEHSVLPTVTGPPPRAVGEARPVAFDPEPVISVTDPGPLAGAEISTNPGGDVVSVVPVDLDEEPSSGLQARPRAVESRISVKRGPPWGYLAVFLGVLVLGGSLIFAGLAPSRPEEEPIVIAPRNTHGKVPMELEPIAVGAGVPGRPAILTVKPEVPVDVTLDGRRIATRQRSPIALDGLEAGARHTLRVEAEGLRAEERTEVIEPGSAVLVTLEKELGTIVLRGVESATIRADKGRVEGLSVVDVPLDTTVKLEIDRPGQRTWTEEVEVTGAEVVELSPPSPRATAKGTLVVNARPVSVVYIDGKKKGTTPVRLKLPPGKHKVTLRHPDGEKRTTTKVVSPNKTTTFVFRWPK